MPYLGGSAGRVYLRAWSAPALRLAAVVLRHGFGYGPEAMIESIDNLVENGRRRRLPRL